MDILRALPLISVLALYYSDRTSETSIKYGVISFIVIHFVLAFIAIIDTGKENPQRWEELSRYGVAYARILRPKVQPLQLLFFIK